jgi:hypothetical protein
VVHTNYTDVSTAIFQLLQHTVAHAPELLFPFDTTTTTTAAATTTNTTATTTTTTTAAATTHGDASCALLGLVLDVSLLFVSLPTGVAFPTHDEAPLHCCLEGLTELMRLSRFPNGEARALYQDVWKTQAPRFLCLLFGGLIMSYFPMQVAGGDERPSVILCHFVSFCYSVIM